jgi:hypothetical protein
MQGIFLIFWAFCETVSFSRIISCMTSLSQKIWGLWNRQEPKSRLESLKFTFDQSQSFTKEKDRLRNAVYWAQWRSRRSTRLILIIKIRDNASHESWQGCSVIVSSHTLHCDMRIATVLQNSQNTRSMGNGNQIIGCHVNFSKEFN